MDHACWDPTGRLLLTSSSSTKTFNIYNAYGKLLSKETRPFELKFILWRNRPQVVLDEKTEAEIAKN